MFNLHLKLYGVLGLLGILLWGTHPDYIGSARTASAPLLPYSVADYVNQQRAIAYIANREEIPAAALRLVDAETITFPLSGATLWRGQVLDVWDRLHLLYEVWIDEETQSILNGRVDPMTYWQTEEQLFREQYHTPILEAVATRGQRAAAGLQVVTGALERHSLTDTWVWSGKVMDEHFIPLQ